MEYCNASENFLIETLKFVDILVDLAKKTEDKNSNDRKSFLRLAIVFIVTRFQVFVESVLDETVEIIVDNNFTYDNFPFFIKLNSIDLFLTEYKLEKKLENKEKYSYKLFNIIKADIEILKEHFESQINTKNFKLKTKYPLGKTGSKELISLFKQFEGKDIFTSDFIDIQVLDSLLSTRHLIVHQDRDNGLTENVVLDYKLYIEKITKHINKYINNFLDNYKNKI